MSNPYLSFKVSLFRNSATLFILFLSQLSYGQNIPDATSIPPTGTMPGIVLTNPVPGIKVNYIRTTMPVVPVALESSLQPTNKLQTSVSTQYMDGLGRAIENIAHFGSPAGKDVVDILQYNNIGKEIFKLMPYTKSESTLNDYGKFKLSPYTDQKTFYQTTLGYSSEQYFYTQTVYEPSPLNRVRQTMPPGNAWAGSGIGKTMTENPLMSGGDIRIWTIAFAPGSLPVSTTYYNANELMVKSVTDEDNNTTTMEYTDKRGKVISEQVTHRGTNPLQTYYVYDDLGLLRFVIPPKATVAVQSASSVSQAIADELCFRYEYDARKRQSLIYTPGAGVTAVVYSLKDHPLLTQNPEQKIINQWSFIKYDVLGRIIQTGVYTSSSPQSYFQTFIDARGSGGRTVRRPDPFLDYLVGDTYGNSSYINSFSNVKIYVTNYYDDYSFTTRSYNPAYLAQLPAGWNSAVTSETTNLLTGTKIWALDGAATPTEMLRVNYYNDRGNLIQTQFQSHKGDWNYETATYDFRGKKLGSLQEINNSQASNNTKITTLETYTYDHAGRILSVSHKLNTGAAMPIAHYIYDEIGRVKTKYSGNGTQQLLYDYNIRNWLTGINKSYCLNNTGNSLFGMELSYDYGYTTNYSNGNISGMKWRNSGKTTELRSYGYSYDGFGRLTTADFVFKTGTGAWTNATKDYTASNITYDANGNILSLKQMGLNGGGTKIILDNLQYTYYANSNKIQKVDELSGSQSTNPALYDGLGDFRDVAAATDYTYDGNGNLKTDVNKNLVYTNSAYLNKPEQVTKGSSGVKYVYDALGNKLQKTTTGAVSAVTDYIGSAVYSNNSLDYILHEEGRIRYVTSPSVGYTYDFFIKDHLGNTRTVYTEVPTGPPGKVATRTPQKYIATSEPQLASTENQLFDNIEKTRSNKPFLNNPGDKYSSRLNGSSKNNIMGPALILKVMAGDSVRISAEALYTPSAGSNPPISQAIVNNFISAFSGVNAVLQEGGAVNAASSSAGNTLANAILGLQQNTPGGGQPRAFLNYILYDEHMKLIPEGSGALKVKNVANTWTTLETGTIAIPQNGFLRVFSSNTSPSDVHIDNTSIIYYAGQLVEEYNYYPYGLVFDQTQAFAGIPKTNYLYNGKELQHNEFGAGNGLELCDYGARMYDSQIARWNGVDLLASKYPGISPYAYCANNPIALVDYGGLGPEKPISAGAIRHKFDNGQNSRGYAFIIYVDQPDEGTRDPKTGMSNVGHTFIQLVKYNEDGSSTAAVFGFYPKDKATPYSPTDKGQLGDNAGHNYDVSITKGITEDKFKKILKLAEDFEKGNYNLCDKNCTDFGLQAADKAGLKLPDTQRTWKAPGIDAQSGSTPADLGQDIIEQKDKISKSQNAIISVSNKNDDRKATELTSPTKTHIE